MCELGPLVSVQGPIRVVGFETAADMLELVTRIVVVAEKTSPSRSSRVTLLLSYLSIFPHAG